jgi:hypothetical protein
MWKRSWFRWTVRCVALLLLALLAMALYYRSRGADELAEARKEFEAKVGPLEPMAYKPRPMPEEENGAVWLLAGAQALVTFQQERMTLGLLADTPSSQWTKEQVDCFTMIKVRNAPALVLLRRTSDMKRCDLQALRGDDGRQNLALVTSARLLAADARDALQQGDADRFSSDARTLSDLALAMEQEPETLKLLLGSYAERVLLPVLQEASGSRALDEAAISKLADLMPSTNLMDAWRRALGKEAADLETRMEADPEREGSSGRPSLRSPLITWVTGDLDHAHYLRLWVETVSWAREPYALRSPSPPHPLGVLPWAGIGSIQASSFGSPAGRMQATLALRQMTTLGLEVRRAGLERGAYPADLSAFPGAKTADPFSGKPVAYKLHTDGSATLAIPDADSLYKKLTEGKRAAIGFTWTLPPVTVGKPPASPHLAK